MLVAHAGGPSRAAKLIATAAPHNGVRRRVQPNDLNSPARRGAPSGQKSKGCAALLKDLRRAGCAATPPIATPRPQPLRPRPVRALEPRRQGYTSGWPLAHRSDKRSGSVSIGCCVSRHKALAPPVLLRPHVSV